MRARGPGVSRHRRRSVALGALAAILLVFTLIGGGGHAAAPPPAMRQVVQLRRAVDAGQRISAADLSLAEVPAAWADVHQLSDPASVVGRRAAIAMPAGSPVMDAEVAQAPELRASRDVTLRLDDAAGLPLDPPDGATGDVYLVEPGRNPRVRLVLSDAFIVASNRQDGATTVTVRVAPAEVAALISAESSGSLRLAGRSTP